MSEVKENEKIPTGKLPTKFTLTVRALVGGYLLYTSYELIDSLASGEPKEKVFFAIAMIAFTIIGIVLLFLSGKSLIKGKYQGGAMDAGDQND